MTSLFERENVCVCFILGNSLYSVEWSVNMLIKVVLSRFIKDLKFVVVVVVVYVHLCPKIHYTRFHVDGEVANLLHVDLLSTRPTSRCNGISETTRHNRHNGLLPAPTCCRLVVYVADLLWTCYGETGVMDFGLSVAYRFSQWVSK